MPQAQTGSSPLAVIAGVILLVVGVLMTLVGLLLLLVGAAGAAFLAEIDPSIATEADAIATLLVATAAILLVMGIVEIIGSIGIFVHKGWARWLGVVAGTIGLVLGFLVLISSFLPPANSGDLILSLIWLAANGFIVAALAAAGEHFRPAYPRR